MYIGSLSGNRAMEIFQYSLYARSLCCLLVLAGCWFSLHCLKQWFSDLFVLIVIIVWKKCGGNSEMVCGAFGVMCMILASNLNNSRVVVTNRDGLCLLTFSPLLTHHLLSAYSHCFTISSAWAMCSWCLRHHLGCLQALLTEELVCFQLYVTREKVAWRVFPVTCAGSNVCRDSSKWVLSCLTCRV